MEMHIGGMSRIGISVPKLQAAWLWYREAFGTDALVSEANTQPQPMSPCAGDTPERAHSVIALNLAGGGAVGLWHCLTRPPKPPTIAPRIADLGIRLAKIKCAQAHIAHAHLRQVKVSSLTPVSTNPAGQAHFYVGDPYGNHIEVIEDNTSWFGRPSKPTGGAFGAVIGSADIDRALPFYQQILGYDQVLADSTGSFEDFFELPGGCGSFRRVILTHSSPRVGPFSRLLGQSQVELVQALDYRPIKIFEGRSWGDLGFTHLTLSVRGLAQLEIQCHALGYPLTVSAPAHPQPANERCAWLEAPDDTLIELVETLRLPLASGLGLYLNLGQGEPTRALPCWLLRVLWGGRRKRLQKVSPPPTPAAQPTPWARTAGRGV